MTAPSKMLLRASLRCRRLEDRLAPAALASLISRAELTLPSDAANLDSYVQLDPLIGRGVGDYVSADGRFVAFQSRATNVVPGQVDTNNTYDVFLYDRVANTTVLVSGANGSPTVTSNGHLRSHDEQSHNAGVPAVSADGRYVVFASNATNIVPGFVATAGLPDNIYVFDRLSGQRTLVSHAAGSSTTSASTTCLLPDISANGQVVIFRSKAVNLVAGFPNPGGGAISQKQHAYAYDMATSQVTLLDHKFGSTNEPGNGTAAPVAITADGRYIVVSSAATESLSGASTSKGDVYRYDRLTGINQLISRVSDVAPFGGNGASGGFAISDDGQWVGVISLATNLVPGPTVTGTQLYLANADTGQIRLISHIPGDPLTGGNNTSIHATMSADGRYVAFRSLASDLVTGFIDGNSATTHDQYLYDRDTDQITLVNHQVNSATTSDNASSAFAAPPLMSSDGRYVTFPSVGTDLVAGFIDRNGPSGHDLYRYDRFTGSVQLVSGANNSATRSGNGETFGSSMSADGNFVALTSEATDLDSGIFDANGHVDVYVKDLTSGTMQLASRRFGALSLSAGGSSTWANQSADGRFVVFADTAKNLIPGQSEVAQATLDVFLMDRATNTTVLVSHAASAPAQAGNSDSGLPVISSDGRFIAYVSYATDLVTGFVDANGFGQFGTDVFLYDRLTGTSELVSRQVGTTNVSGNYGSGNFINSVAQLSISGDGRWIAFMSQASDLMSGFVDNNGTDVLSGGGADVFLFDRLNGTHSLVHHLPGQPAATSANGVSRFGSVSNDGNYFVYLSGSTDVIPGMSGSMFDEHVILYDRITDTHVLVSHATGSATAVGNDDSNSIPMFSRDGNFVLYGSFASNLIAGGSDTNGKMDVFLYDRQTGATTLVSHAAGSSVTAGNGHSYNGLIQNYNDGRFISADGRYIVYTSEAQDLVAGFVDGNPADSTDVYLFDRVTGTNVLVSRSIISAVTSGNRDSLAPTVSGDGRLVAFVSEANNIVPGMTFPASGIQGNIYLFDRLLGTMTLVTRDFNNPNAGADRGISDLTINSNGSVIIYTSPAANLVPDDLNGFSDVFAYVQLPPTVTSVIFGDGTNQRSLVKRIVVAFSEPVSFTGGVASAFTLTRTGPGGTTGNIELTADPTSGPTSTVTITFSGSLTEFGSLVDGVYDFIISAAQVSGVGGALDGNNDGIAGGSYVVVGSSSNSFYRLFGDANGDRIANLRDFAAFRSMFGQPSSIFDFDDDGYVLLTDFDRFRERFSLIV